MNFLSQHFLVLISILQELIINILKANKGCNEILETSDPQKIFLKAKAQNDYMCVS